MKILIALVLIFAVQTMAANKPCADFLPGKWVQLKNGQTVAGLFACSHCPTLVKVQARPDGSIDCPNCGHPFDGSEKSQPPPNKTIGGQVYVPENFLITSSSELQLFNSGPHWMCGSCTTRNFQGQHNCVRCGAPKSGQDAKFDPHAEDEAKPMTDDIDTPAIHAQAPSPVVSRSQPMGRNFRIAITSSVVAAAAAVGVGTWTYFDINAGPLTGVIAEKKAEAVIFPNQAAYDRLKSQILDLAHPPENVQVRVWDGSQKSIAVPNGAYAVTKYYFVVEVGSKSFTTDVSAAEFQRWNVKDPVELSFSGPFDFELRPPK